MPSEQGIHVGSVDGEMLKRPVTIMSRLDEVAVAIDNLKSAVDNLVSKLEPVSSYDDSPDAESARERETPKSRVSDGLEGSLLRLENQTERIHNITYQVDL